jgi:hypothetical protein
VVPGYRCTGAEGSRGFAVNSSPVPLCFGTGARIVSRVILPGLGARVPWAADGCPSMGARILAAGILAVCQFPRLAISCSTHQAGQQSAQFVSARGTRVPAARGARIRCQGTRLRLGARYRGSGVGCWGLGAGASIQKDEETGLPTGASGEGARILWRRGFVPGTAASCLRFRCIARDGGKGIPA